MRLRTTLFGLLLVISIVLAGTVYAGFALHKSEVREQERLAIEGTADHVASDIDSRLIEKRTTVELQAADPALTRHGDLIQQYAIARLVDRTEFGGASVVAANGTMVAFHGEHSGSDRREELVGQDFSHRTYVQAALNGTAHVGDPLHAASGNEIVTVSAPIRQGDRIVGALTAALHIDEVAFFEPSREILQPGERLHVAFGGPVSEFGTSPGPGFMDASATVPSVGWEVTVSQQSSTVEDRLWLATVFQAGAVGVALVSVAVVGVWISRTTLRHLAELIDGLTGLESGDYETRVDLGATDEWSRIASQFNDLAETLRQRDSQLEVLNRVLRHNLRNDMSVIIAHADTVIHDDDADTETRRKVRTIRRTAHNLMQTSEHARSIYAELLGGEPRDERPIDVVPIVTGVLEDLREEFPEAAIDSHLPDRAVVLGRESISIAVEELCRNALLHNDRPPEDREVTVAVESRPEAAEVLLLVSDNGPGIPQLEAELLTGEREQTAIEHGSGLGLWVVNWLVESLDGSVSTRDGGDRGTTVEASLPAASDETAGEAADGPGAHGTDER